MKLVTLRRIGDGMPFTLEALLQGHFDLRFDRFWCEAFNCEYKFVRRGQTLKAVPV